MGFVMIESFVFRFRVLPVGWTIFCSPSVFSSLSAAATIPARLSIGIVEPDASVQTKPEPLSQVATVWT